MLAVFPPEICLTILSFIPVRQLHRLPQVSRAWTAFFATNESFIYHAAALLHDFVPSGASFQDAKASHVPWLDDVDNWKDLCRKHYSMERHWEGHGDAKSAALGAAGGKVHRFKIDDEQRTVITTHSDGGLRVCAIEEDEILWSLPQTEVQEYTHCEYAAGFLVLTRSGEAMEVWRRKRDASINPHPFALNPDSRQERAHQHAWQSPKSVSENDRGAFVPWTTIMPINGPVQASRLVHPTLLITSIRAQEAYLYDVSTGRLMQVISFGNQHGPPVRVYYVELGSRHIFICSENDVLVFPRGAGDTGDTGALRRLWKFPNQVENAHTLYKKRTYSLHIHDDDFQGDDSPSSQSRSTLIDCPLEDSTDYLVIQQPHGRRPFNAVHVSPCGSHFAAVDVIGRLFIVRNFEQCLCGDMRLSEHVWILDLCSPITHLAFEEDKRLVIHVQDRGLFVVPFTSENGVSVDTLDMQPHRPYPRLLHLGNVGRHGFSRSSCVQMTRKELWYTWSRIDRLFGAQDARLYYLDLS